MALRASIADRDAVIAAVEALREAFGPVTILVNNAGISLVVPFEEITDAQWTQMFDINVRGTFVVTQVVLPDMKKAHWGRIVNISSSSAQTGSEIHVHYASSKGAVIAMTRALANALGPDGITVNNIPPGSVMGTIMSEANISRETVERLEATLPVRRIGRPEDIATACAWLCREESSYVTGQTIGVNGGRVVS
jgi:2-hydroxycyclohexanecarboxyl-CoA dehydrogenase